MILMRVDLPAPFSPTKEWISPGRSDERHLGQRLGGVEALGDPLDLDDRPGIAHTRFLLSQRPSPNLTRFQSQVLDRQCRPRSLM